MDNKSIIEALTLNEKAALCSGKDFWHTVNIDRLNVPSLSLSDGPNGLRKQASEKADNLGISKSINATCFPTASCIASSFDRNLIYHYGKALGEQCRGENTDVLLGPGINIKRSPLCGRNFEYLSEDPYLSGEMASSYIRGIQSQGIGVCVKHFAANNQEKRRMTVSSEIDERAFREIYLSAFEKVIKNSKPLSVMCSYNKIDSTYSSENFRLLTEILRNEWGFEGAVVSDWGAVNDRVKGIKAGLDLEMPSSGMYNTNKIIKAVNSGDLSEEELDRAVERILTLINNAGKKPPVKYDRNDHLKRAVKFAKESMVLLKNDGVLPLCKDKKIAVIGKFAKEPRYQGSGSSRINSFRVLSFLEAVYDIENITYSPGYHTRRDFTDPLLVEEAVENAKNAEVAVIFAGLPDAFESEGFDRKTLRMPKCQNELIERICRVQKNVVVVLHNGSPVTMPWLDKVNAVLECYLAGDGVGIAQKHILFGKANPSGKLAETFPLSLKDTPCHAYLNSDRKFAEYRESIFVGYRYYDKSQKPVLFPFGHGLSYTQFEYTSISLDTKKKKKDTDLTVSVTVKNTGNYDGAEVVQIYVSPVGNALWKAKSELKGFEKVFLKKGEEKTVTVSLDDRAFSHYDTEKGDWQTEDGKYDISAGSSSRDIRLTASVTVKGNKYEDLSVPDCYKTGEVQNVSQEDFEKLLGRKIPRNEETENNRITMNNTIEDAKNSKWGGKIYSFIMKTASLMTKTSLGSGEMIANTVLELPINRFITMTSGKFTEEMAQNLVNILNDDEPGENLRSVLKEIPSVVGSLIK